MKLKKNGFVTFQVKIRHDGGLPDGGLELRIEQYNNNVLTGNAPRQYRDTNSSIVYTTGTASNFNVAGSLLLVTWQVFWAVFQFNSLLGTTKQLRFTFNHHDTTNGHGIYISDPMVNDGTDRRVWTAEMNDPYISQPVPGNPPGEPPRDGRRQWDKLA